MRNPKFVAESVESVDAVKLFRKGAPMSAEQTAQLVEEYWLSDEPTESDLASDEFCDVGDDFLASL